MSADWLAAFYGNARRYVVAAGYERELAWQEGVTLDTLTESVFLREAGWVILASGMRESVVRGIFPAISAAFCEWRSAAEIEWYYGRCEREALRYFHHPAKIRAILKVCREVANEGFVRVRQAIDREGLAYIRRLPFMGPVTSFHLAKNIGLQCVKPDRHLVRMAAAAGYENPAEMCAAIAQAVGEKLSVIDLVLWRYAVSGANYRATLHKWRKGRESGTTVVAEVPP